MTEALTLDRLRLSASSSSRSMEKTVIPSRLPPQASIAGQSVRTSPWGEWAASMERLGHERSRFEEVLTDIRTVTEALVWGKLAETPLPSIWVVETDQPFAHMCFRLASHYPVCSGSQFGERTYVLRLEPTSPLATEAGAHQGQAGEPWEPVVPDTNRAYTIQQMAQAWGAIGRPITEDDVPLSVDPDDYPLF